MKRKKMVSRKPSPKATPPAKVVIHQMPTGVRGLDKIIGGGLPEFSFNIIAGVPGCGKTTLAHQIVFANATPRKPALYFTMPGEPALKMLRYQQQYSFFDPARLGKSIRFINLSHVVLEKALGEVLDEIVREVEVSNPSIVVVDSFRMVLRNALGRATEMERQSFVHRLALQLTTWQATTFLIGEYLKSEMSDDPVFNVADGLFWLTQDVEGNSVTRKLQIIKLRGQESVAGLHTIRISSDGLQAFSHTLGLNREKVKPARLRRLSIGIPELDKMMGGGIREGDSVLVSGPSGTGKSALATQFLAAGLREGESGIAAIFEERPEDYASRAKAFGLDLGVHLKSGKLEILYLRPLDLSVDEAMQEILDGVKRVHAKRLVIDSLGGFEMALALRFREDFRESLYRMIAALTGAGVTILTTVEVEQSCDMMEFSRYAISFLTDDILRLHYVEIDSQLRKVLVIIKMRGGDHSKDIREYVITDRGLVLIAQRKSNFIRLTTGLPERIGPRQEKAPEPKAHA